MELLTLKTVDTPIEAHLLKSRLEHEGIVAFIFDENMIALNPLFNLTLGGIKLKVHSSDWKKAQEILKQIDDAVLTDDDNKRIKCPRCQSTDLYYGFKSMKGFFGALSAILSIFSGSYPLYFKSVYKCKNCGAEFKTKTS